MTGYEGAVNEFLLSSDIYYLLPKLMWTLQQELTSAVSLYSFLIPGNAKENSFCSSSYLLGFCSGYFFLFVCLVFGWFYCVLNFKTVIGFITAWTPTDLGLQYTAFCTQTKHSSSIMACYTYTTVKVCCFCYTLLSGRNSYWYFPTDCGQYQYGWNKS